MPKPDATKAQIRVLRAAVNRVYNATEGPASNWLLDCMDKLNRAENAAKK